MKKKTYFANMTISVVDILLDIDNPRLLSRVKRFTNLDIYESQFILIYLLFSKDKVDDLIEEILSEPYVSLEILNAERLIVQLYSSQNGNYIVKEGNRRVSAIQIIKNPKLLDVSYNFLEEKDLISRDELKKYKNLIEKIQKKLSNAIEIGNTFDNIEVVVYENSMEANKRIKNILRIIHLKTKNKWDSVDKNLFDYDTVQHAIKNSGIEFKDINDVLHFLAEQEYSVTNERSIKNIESNLKKEVHQSSIYYYILDLISRNYDDIKKRNLIYDLENRYLHYTREFPSLLFSLFNISINQVIEKKELKIVFSNGDNLNSLFFPLNKEKIFEEMVLHLLEKGELISSPKLRNYKKTTNSIDGDFLSEFSVISQDLYKLREQATQEDKKDSKDEPATSMPRIVLQNDSLTCNLFNDPINLCQNIIAAYDCENKNIKIEDIQISYKKKSSSNTISSTASLIPSQEEESSIIVTYKYNDIKDGLDFPISKNMSIVFKDNSPSPIVSKKSLITTYPTKNYTIDFNYLPKALINEIGSFNYSQHRYISGTLLRLFWETTIREFNHHGYSFQSKDSTGQIKEMEAYILDKLKLTKDRELVSIYYGLHKESTRDILLNLKDYDRFLSAYTQLNSFMHGYHDDFTNDNIDALARITSKWIYLVKYCIDSFSF